MKLSYDIDNTVAILIGTGNYEKHDFISISPVKGNLEDLKNILSDKDIFGLHEDRIFVLEDKTNLEIVATLQEILSEISLKTVFLYYSGHGQRTSKDRLYLTAYNSVKNFELIEYTGIEFSKFKRIIENSPGKPNSIVIIDACYSGIAAQSDSALTEEERTINGAYIITSSSSKEQSFFDPIGRHTFFTEELIDILSNGSEKSDMLLSINDIYDNLQKRLRVKNLSEPQRRDNLDTKNFFIAKNKKYNKEFFLRKAEEFFKDGNYSRAIEYYFILQDRFKDTDYSKFIDKCREEIKYSTLVMDGDSFFISKKFELALGKYNEAKKIKSDSSLLFKISSSEDYIRMKKDLLEEQQRQIEEEKLNAKRDDELKKNQIKSEETVNVSVADPAQELSLFVKRIFYNKYFKFVGLFFFLVIIGYIIFYSTNKKNIPNESEKSIVKQPLTFPFKNRDSIQIELNKYLLSLYNGDSLHLIQKNVSFTYPDLNGPQKYNPFAGDEYSSNKLLFRGITTDSLINSIYYCGFTLIGGEDSIEARLAGKVNNDYNQLEIISVRYEEIIPLKNIKVKNIFDTPTINTKPKPIYPKGNNTRQTENEPKPTVKKPIVLPPKDDPR